MCICTSFGAGGEGIQLPGGEQGRQGRGSREDREGGPGRERRGLEERGGALDCVFVIANKAVGWGWDGITGSGVRGPFGARQGLRSHSEGA